MESNENISIDVYLQALKKNIIFFVGIIAVTVALIGIYGNFIKTKLYESKATISASYLNENGDVLSYDKMEANQMIINDFQFYIQSDEVLDKVSESVDMTNDEIASTLSFKQNTNSNYITITSRTTSSKKAYEIVNTICDICRDSIKNKNNLDIEISNKATKNDKQVSPQMGTYYKFAVILGFVLACLYIVFKVNF